MVAESARSKGEEEQEGEKLKTGGDGMPRLLTRDDFYQKVVEHNEAQEQAEAEKETRRLARENRAAEKAEWKREDDARKARNADRKAQWKEAVKEWEVERDLKRTQ